MITVSWRSEEVMARPYGRAGPATSGEPPNRAGRGMGDLTHSQQAVLVGVGGGRGARGDAQLGEDVAHVAVDRPLAEDERGGDRAVGLPGGDAAQDLELAARQAVGGGGRCVEPREAARGAELLEAGARGVELQARGVLVTQRAARRADERAGAGA